MTQTLMLLVACTVLAGPAVGQSDDAAYCAQLAALARRYTGSAGGDGGLRTDFATMGAIDDCNKGNTAAGIAEGAARAGIHASQALISASRQGAVAAAL